MAHGPMHSGRSVGGSGRTNASRQVKADRAVFRDRHRPVSKHRARWIPAQTGEPYIDAASAVVREAYRTAPIVVAEGPMAWPVVQSIVQEIPSGEVRRVYLRRMSSTHPDLWHDGEFLYECERPTVYGQSIDRYHAHERPWLLADVVFERIGRDDE
jgi:hypothetical protein